MNNETISQIITQTALDIIPEEGEIVTFKGGRGNATLKQIKKEDGEYYTRDNESCQWNIEPNFIWDMYVKTKKLLDVLYTDNKTNKGEMKNENAASKTIWKVYLRRLILQPLWSRGRQILEKITTKKNQKEEN